MALKRDATDAAFSDAVREAADWICQRCERPFMERKGRDAQCSHFISRSFHSTRWFPDNAALLCGACHYEVGSNPHEHALLFKRLLGETRYEWLLKRKQMIVRYRASDKKAMREHFRKQTEAMREQRLAGVCGPLPLVPYD